MASNEVEVLDPAPTVEKLKKFASERVLNRRHFIAALGAAGAAVAGTELVRQGPTALAQQPKPSGYAQTDVLNFLLNIKYLKATLYSYITQGADLPAADFANLGTGGVFNVPSKITFSGVGSATTQEITDLFNEIYYDELEQLIGLRTLIAGGSNANDSAVASRPTINLLGTGATTTATTTMTQPQFIGYARLLEDLSASAFAGATIYLTGTNLAYVTQALAVNGFHAGAVRLLAIQTGAYYYSGQEVTLGSAGAGTADSFTGYTTSGSPIVYNTAPTNAIVAGTDISGAGIPEGTTIASVVPNTVFTGSITAGSNQITNFAVTPSTATVAPAVGMVVSGTGIPTNSIITAVNGTTLTIGTVTGYTSLTPLAPIINGLTAVTGSGGSGMTPGTYPLAFTGGQGTGAAGTLTVLTPSTFSVIVTSYGQGYTSIPTVTATGLTVSTGGTLPTLAASVGAQITTTANGVVLTLGFLTVVTKGSAALASVSTTAGLVATAGLVPGQFLTGTGVPANAIISSINSSTATVTMSAVGGGTAVASASSTIAPTGIVTNGSAVITDVSSTSGLAVGQPITGTGIPSGATITGLGFDPAGPNITISAAATATSATTSTVTPTSFLTAGSNVVTALSSLTGLATGDPVTGTGIPANTVVGSVGTVNTMTLLNATTQLPANATTTTALTTAATPNGILSSGSVTVSQVYPLTGLATGQLITDAQGLIPSGTTITAYSTTAYTITLSAPATGATTVTPIATFTGDVIVSYETISAVSSFTGLAVGQPIAGPNIAAGTIITALSPSTNSLTISAFPSAATGAQLIGASLVVTSAEKLTASTLQKITVTTNAPTEAVTVPNIETVSLNLLGNVVLSQNVTATAATGVSLTFLTSDSMDVQPDDLGSAAASAGGPAAIPGTSPPAYQGFFDTAGAATSSANNPAGSVFARTFSQTLAVLYGSTTPQTYEGGFFPVGVAGGINFV